MINHNVPDFLTKKNEILKFLVFVAFFALVFIIIYKPFGSMKWMVNINMDTYFLYTFIIVFVGFLALSLSRFLLYKVQNKLNLSLHHYIFWLAIELFVIAMSCALVGYSIDNSTYADFFEIIPRVFLYTASILFIPYVVSWLYFSLKEKEKTLELLIAKNNPQPLVESMENTDFVKFYDKKGNLCFSVMLDNLYYVESYENYVKIFYQNKSELCCFILRNTLSSLEQRYTAMGLVRCHRSFMVNIGKVRIVIKNKDHYKLELAIDNSPVIPISKSYVSNFIQLIME